jgi:acetyl-CoA carboxylase/biotin carboxylase 1
MTLIYLLHPFNFFHTGKFFPAKTQPNEILSPSQDIWISKKPMDNTFTSKASVMDEVESTISLNAAKREEMDAFVKKLGGHRPIQRILIANNGMAATKAIVSMRQWAYMTFGKND